MQRKLIPRGRRPLLRAVPALVCLAVLSATPVRGTTIVVDVGGHGSALAAGAGEAGVDWRDADTRDDAVCTQAFAALELQRYLREMTRAPESFPILDDEAAPLGDVIIIGGPATNALAEEFADAMGVSQASLEELGPEGYVIRTAQVRGRQVTLVAGGGRVGTLYGVYDLLHRLGVRWYAPGAVNEEVPLRELPTMPDFDVRQVPAFFTRGFHADDGRGTDEFLLWMARNRLNFWSVEQSNKPLLRKLGLKLAGGGHMLTSLYLNPKAVYPYDHPQFQGDEHNPKDPYAVGSGYEGDGDRDGALSYFEAHPEWFALRNNKRSPRVGEIGGDNFCTSNDDAMAEWMKNAIDDLAEGRYRDADYMNAWTLDRGRWCGCGACAALGSPTDRNILLAHRYDREIKKAQADGRITRPVRLFFLVFADVVEPPTRPPPEGFDRETCIANFFPITRCYVHTLDAPDCSINARYDRLLSEWVVDPLRHYRGEICIGEYYNVSKHECLPVCFMHTMCSDIPYYHWVGARHFHYMHCPVDNWGNKALTNWQMARQIWDPGTDCDALWADYFQGRYGPAHAEMRLFYESLEEMLSNVSQLKYGLPLRLQQGVGDLFQSPHLQYEATALDMDDGPDMMEILEAARTCREIIDSVLATDLPPRVRHRIEEDERLFTYGERTVRYYGAACRAYFTLRAGETEEARRALDEARVLADLLSADTTSTKLAPNDAGATNALVATYAPGALMKLETELGPERPEDVPTVDASGEPLIIAGSESIGGGAPAFGYGFDSPVTGERVSETGNYVYGGGTPYDRMIFWLRVEGEPEHDLDMRMIGLVAPRQAGGHVTFQMRLNGKLVVSRHVSFGEDELGSEELIIPRRRLKPGVNLIEIRNSETRGVGRGRPWLGIDRIEITARQD